MSIASLKAAASATTDRAVSGSQMDKVVERGGLSRKVKIAIGAGVALVAALLFWWFMPGAGSQTVTKNRLTISSVQTGRFEDFIPLRAKVTPLLTVYIDSIEGGRVDKVLVEDGTDVVAGQQIAALDRKSVV